MRTKLALFMVAACIGFLLACAPLEFLLNNFIPDDSFYYHKTALNIAMGHGSTFDGIHRSNGYHPLWLLFEVPIFLLFGGGGEGPFRAILALQALLYGGAASALYSLFNRGTNSVAAAAAAVAWISFTVLSMVNGLETVLYCVLLFVLAGVWLDFCAAERPAHRQCVLLGLFMGLTFLARTDAAFLAAILSVAVLARLRRLARMAAASRIVAYLIPAATLAGGYLLLNVFYFGGLMQVSGAAKGFYSQQILADQLHQGSSWASVTLKTALWPLTQQNYLVLLSIWSIPVTWLIAKLLRPSGVLRQQLTLYLRLTPFWLAFCCTYFFYVIAYKGGFAQTGWYYTPAYLHAAFILFLFFSLFRCGTSLAAYWPACFALITFLLSERLSYSRSFLILAIVAVLAACFRLTSMLARARPERTSHQWESYAFIVVLFALLWRFHASAYFLISVVALTIVLALVVAVRQRRSAEFGLAVAVLLGVSICSFTLRYAISRNMASEPNYNYLLYKGALWLKENTAPAVRITAGSAGILGYFSERTVINTDGLINSYDYLDNYIRKGRTVSYFGQVSDVFVDVYAFDFGDALRAAYPDGYFVETSPDLRVAAFMDGPVARRFQVYLLHGDRSDLFSGERGESILNGDFETGDLTGWTKTGTAFDDQPTFGDNSYARGTLPSLPHGQYYIGTFEKRSSPSMRPAAQGNEPTGTLTSQPFVLRGSSLCFRIGGGNLPGTRVELLVEGKVVATMRGENLDTMKTVQFDVRPYHGQMASVRIVDQETGPWGIINADDFRLLP
jgi:hypothetical protein